MNNAFLHSLGHKQKFNQSKCCCAFAQRALGKPLSKPRVTVANLIRFSSNRIGMHSQKKRLARERLTMSKMIGIYCSAHRDSSGDILCATCRNFKIILSCGCTNVPMEKTSQLAPTVLFTAISRLEGLTPGRSCDTPVPRCCCATRYSLLPTSWMASARPGTHVSLRASKDCSPERNDKRPSPVYYTQRGSTIIAGVSY